MAHPSTVARDIKQTRGFANAAEEATVALLRTADVVRGELERTLAGRGITLQQYNVLRILRGAHPGRMPTLEIADRMIERAPGITRLLDRLEAADLVSRQRCREDRRQVLCAITAKGLAVLGGCDEPIHAAERVRHARLTKADLARLVSLLDRLREECA